MKKAILGITLLATVQMSACTSVTPNQTSAAPPQRGATYSVAKQIGAGGGKTFFLIKNGDGWKVSRTGNIYDDSVEQVAVNAASKVITLQTEVESKYSTPSSGTWPCLRGIGGQSRKDSGYTICTSKLTKGAYTPGNVAISVIAAPFLMLSGSVGATVEVDQDKILEIAKSSGLLDMAEQDAQAEITAEYHKLFAEATTPAAIKYFAGKYQNKDPEGLVPQAQARMQQAELNQYRNIYNSALTISGLRAFATIYASNDPDKLVPIARKRAKEKEDAIAKADADQARIEAQRIKEEDAFRAEGMKRVVVFRKSLKEGGETNCGPVIESKEKLVKVSFSVSGYGNEHWIRRDEIFPSSYGCRFLNGQYQSP